MSLRYRPEIDGLRAIAVIPVILYHADKSLSSGGFVGVDVFFVISGYLITLLLLNDLASERFSILNFYERRARRILPALSAVMLACLPMAYFSLMPDAARDFSKSLVSVALFSSNFLFWYHSGYFDVASELKPLIHTWSLAVEEQYYLLFPLALLLMWRFARRWIFLLFALLAALSLAISQWGVWIHPSVAFYWLPMRGWELLIGAMVAFDEFKSQSWGKKEKFGSFGALIGLALIAIPMFLFTDKTPFPGVNALLPTAGAALVIYFATQKNLAGRILGSKPLVGIGLISYSAYLWHQPLFAFALTMENHSPHPCTRYANEAEMPYRFEGPTNARGTCELNEYIARFRSTTSPTVSPARRRRRSGVPTIIRSCGAGRTTSPSTRSAVRLRRRSRSGPSIRPSSCCRRC